MSNRKQVRDTYILSQELLAKRQQEVKKSNPDAEVPEEEFFNISTYATQIIDTYYLPETQEIVARRTYPPGCCTLSLEGYNASLKAFLEQGDVNEIETLNRQYYGCDHMDFVPCALCKSIKMYDLYVRPVNENTDRNQDPFE